MKIEEQVLSREQMAHLVELGVDTSDASMYWSHENSCGDRYWVLLPYDKDYGYDEETIPAYTIGDLILKVSNFFNEFSFSEGKPKDMLYSCLCWMAKNKKELIK